MSVFDWRGPSQSGVEKIPEPEFVNFYPSKKEKAMPIQRMREMLDYSPEDGCFFWRERRNQNVAAGDLAGGMGGDGYLRIMVDGFYFLTHRIVWAFEQGEWPDSELDHIDRVRTNNVASNLRKATSSQNAQNRGMRSDNTSGFKGVTWCKKQKKWAAQIWYDKGNHFLGFFDTAEQAGITYATEATKRHERAPVFDFSCYFTEQGDRDRKAINGR